MGEGPVDEPHGAGAHSEFLRRFVGGVQHPRIVRKRQIAVRVHADELEIAARDAVTGAAPAAGGDVTVEHPLGRLRAPFLLERLDVTDQSGVEPSESHVAFLVKGFVSPIAGRRRGRRAIVAPGSASDKAAGGGSARAPFGSGHRSDLR
jgi:hypothetical protein